MDQKNKTPRAKNLIIQIVLLACLILAGIEISYNLSSWEEKQKNAACNAQSRHDTIHNTLQNNPGQDSLIWKETEFMN